MINDQASPQLLLAGGSPALSAEEHKHHGNELREVLAIINAAGRFEHLYDPVTIPDSPPATR